MLILYASVMVTEPGATAEQIESKVTKKIEDAVGKIFLELRL